MNDLIPLTLLATKLRTLTGTPCPGYRALYTMVVDGRLPAVPVNGRWHIRGEDLPVIAAALKLPAISVGQTAHAA